MLTNSCYTYLSTIFDCSFCEKRFVSHEGLLALSLTCYPPRENGFEVFLIWPRWQLWISVLCTDFLKRQHKVSTSLKLRHDSLACSIISASIKIATHWRATRSLYPFGGKKNVTCYFILKSDFTTLRKRRYSFVLVVREKFVISINVLWLFQGGFLLFLGVAPCGDSLLSWD